MTAKPSDTPGLKACLKKRVKSIFNYFTELLYPQTCAYCGEVIESGEYVCNYCYTMLERIDLNKLCSYCGNSKKKCKCNTRIYHFNEVIAPFYNTEISGLIMNRFKFRHYEALSLFFAREMALSVKQCYTDKNFDFITYVPMTKFKQFRKGYNQSRLLAEELSKILHIPIAHNILFSHKKRKSQHKTTSKERFDNVRQIYYTKKRISGGTVLLVDDIKTTGATLDSCARQLLMCGADKVYCISALITESQIKKGKENGN